MVTRGLARTVELLAVLEGVVTLRSWPEHADVTLLALLDGDREVLGFTCRKGHVVTVAVKREFVFADHEAYCVALVGAVIAYLDGVLGAVAGLLAARHVGTRPARGEEED